MEPRRGSLESKPDLTARRRHRLTRCRGARKKCRSRTLRSAPRVRQEAQPALLDRNAPRPLALGSRLQICSRIGNGGRAWRTGRGLMPYLPLDMLPERRTLRVELVLSRGAGVLSFGSPCT